MIKIVSILTLVTVLAFAISAFAADTVVVIPLPTCSDGLTKCSGQCVDTMNNPDFCGGCTTVCGAGSFCSNGTCTKTLGEACITGGECTSGYCVDGLCCATACSSLCESCQGINNGGVDGTCGFVASLTDPDNECAGSMDCNGYGGCGDSCTDGVQNKDETDVDCGGVICSARCNENAICRYQTDCETWLVCWNYSGGGGVCQGETGCTCIFTP